MSARESAVWQLVIVVAVLGITWGVMWMLQNDAQQDCEARGGHLEGVGGTGGWVCLDARRP